jgi:hypothetical protein
LLLAETKELESMATSSKQQSMATSFCVIDVFVGLWTLICHGSHFEALHLKDWEFVKGKLVSYATLKFPLHCVGYKLG